MVDLDLVKLCCQEFNLKSNMKKVTVNSKLKWFRKVITNRNEFVIANSGTVTSLFLKSGVISAYFRKVG
jgi:hypothetical protein